MATLYELLLNDLDWLILLVPILALLSLLLIVIALCFDGISVKIGHIISILLKSKKWEAPDKNDTGFTSSDFPLAHLSKSQLDRILNRILSDTLFFERYTYDAVKDKFDGELLSEIRDFYLQQPVESSEHGLISHLVRSFPGHTRRYVERRVNALRSPEFILQIAQAEDKQSKEPDSEEWVECT